MVRSVVAAVVAVLAALAPAVPSAGAAPPAVSARYAGEVGTAYDEWVGAAPVICDGATGDGRGGACIPFGPDAGLVVADALGNPDVLAMVCVDHDGDARCGGYPPGQPCADELFRNYDSSGRVRYPVLGPLPSGFRPGCPGGAFPGYVVFVYGVSGPQLGPASAGTVTRVTGGQAFAVLDQYTELLYQVRRLPAVAALDGSAAGPLCQFGYTFDPTALVVYDPNETLALVLTGGPWLVPEATDVTVTCTVQVNDGSPGAGARAVVSATTPGPVGQVAGTAALRLLPRYYETPYVCTYLSWTAGGTTRYLSFDEFGRAVASASGPGGQCVQVPRPYAGL